MKTIPFLMLIFLFIGINSNAQSVNTEQSVVKFKVSNLALNHVKGTFHGMKGQTTFSPQNLSDTKFDICIDASSINTENNKRDKHLRSEDFFNVDKYPTICFKSSGPVEKTKDGYLVKGTLNMHGVSKKIEIPFTYSNHTLNASIELERLDYNIGEDTGKFFVGNDIEVQITCVLNE